MAFIRPVARPIGAFFHLLEAKLANRMGCGVNIHLRESYVRVWVDASEVEWSGSNFASVPQRPSLRTIN
jgi:hypothetical protein